MIPVTLQTILQASEDGMHGRCEEDQGGGGNEGPMGGNVSKVIFSLVHYVYVIPYMIVWIGWLKMHDNDLIIG